MNVRNKRMVVLVLTAMAIVAMAGVALAMTSSTGTGSEMYDLVVTDFIQGPIGTAAGTSFIVVGAVMAVMGKISAAIYPLIGGGMLASSSSLATSLGATF